jgi:hypothetical protein
MTGYSSLIGLGKSCRRYALNVLDADGNSTRSAIHLQVAPRLGSLFPCFRLTLRSGRH